MTRIPEQQIERRLAAAATAENVVAIVQNFLEAWSAGALAKLPENCRPDAVRSASDIQWYADLFATECQSGELIGPELQAMCDLFGMASRRLREIDSTGERGTRDG